MAQVVNASVGQPRFRTMFLSIFAMLALVIASLGIYAATSHRSCSEHECSAFDVALGATAGDVLRLVLGRAAVLIVSGLGLGLAASFTLARLEQAALRPRDCGLSEFPVRASTS